MLQVFIHAGASLVKHPRFYMNVISPGHSSTATNYFKPSYALEIRSRNSNLTACHTVSYRWISWRILPWELEGITSPYCLLIGQYPHHMTLCPPVAIVKRCYEIHLYLGRDDHALVCGMPGFSPCLSTSCIVMECGVFPNPGFQHSFTAVVQLIGAVGHGGYRIW